MSLNGSAQSIGSPSRMRGKEGDELGLGQTIRITPACAGKSPAHPAACPVHRDHPRVCGEKKPAPSGLDSQQGSPPRVRGKVPVTVFLCFCAGITPACAGKSRAMRPQFPLHRDHPRVCGEKSYWSILARNSLGSPPRVRGKAVFPARQHRTAGITPAGAGKRRLASPGKKSHGDHPCVCGEKLSTTSTDIHPAGSPPPVRGKERSGRQEEAAGGITPAYAGKRNGWR